MATYRYYRYVCEDCENDFESMVDVSDGSLTDTSECERCGGTGHRAPAFTLNKGELEERVWGGRMTNGKLYRQHTGFKEVAAQRAEENRLKKARREGNKEEMADAKKALKRLQDETKRSITK